jgi:hypothetical protein
MGNHTYGDESPAAGFALTVHLHLGTAAASVQGTVLVREAPLPRGTSGVTAAHPFGTAEQRFVQELFVDVFGVRPSAGALNGLIGLLHPGPRAHQHRMSRSGLINSLLTPRLVHALHERARHAGGGSSDKAIINGYFRLFLDSDASRSALANGLRKLHGAGEKAVIVAILSSSQYYNKTRF